MPENGGHVFLGAAPAAAYVSGQSGRHLTSVAPLSRTSFLRRAAVSTDTDLSTEFSSDYSEFVVDLKAPYGFALAPDLLGQVAFTSNHSLCNFCRCADLRRIRRSP